MTEMQAKVRDYPDDTGGEAQFVIVKSHWNMSDRVVIEVGGKRATVLVKDLVEAANRCARWR